MSPTNLLLLSLATFGHQHTALVTPDIDVTGVVFIDQNGNGTRDPGEPGVPGVAVSDQDQVVLTTADGSFQIFHSHGNGIVFVSVPDGYRAARGFWQAVDSSAGSRALSFPLLRTTRVSEFTFIHGSDTHISEVSIARTERFRDLSDSVKPAFVLVSGDLVRDALRVPAAEASRLYELYLSEIAKFTAPVWSVPGNHENFGIERLRSLVSPTHPLYGRRMFRHYLGPDYYSFNYGGIHFVGLNSVDYEDMWYYGHIDSVQVEWLKRDLAAVSPTTPVVTFNHIPFFTAGETINGYMDSPPAPTAITVRGHTQFRHAVSNAKDVIRLIQTHPYTLALAGHMHMRETIVYETAGPRIRFHQAAAIVGSSEDGALSMRSGITVYRVRNGQVDDGHFIPLEAGPPIPH